MFAVQSLRGEEFKAGFFASKRTSGVERKSPKISKIRGVDYLGHFELDYELLLIMYGR